jgi:hypothetical protein
MSSRTRVSSPAALYPFVVIIMAKESTNNEEIMPNILSEFVIY